MKKINSIILSCVLVTLLVPGACRKTLEPIPEDISARSARAQANESPGFIENDMVLQWNDYLCRVLTISPGAPPIQLRHSAMVQLAVHDALNAIKPKYASYALLDDHRKRANPDAAVASAAYWTAKKINESLQSIAPTFLLRLQSGNVDWQGWYEASIASIEDDPESIEAGKALGEAAAAAIVANRSSDNFAATLPVYTIIAAPVTPPPAGIWRPTISAAPIPAYHTGGLPKWGLLMKSFSGLANDQFRSAAPPALTSSAYARDYNEVRTLGARTGSTRTAGQSQIANFWQDRPVLIWNRLVRESLKTKKNDAWKSARLLALVNAGIFDGMLTSFDGMYYFNRWRPETAIRLGDTDDNDDTEKDAAWIPYVTDIPPGTFTPPIPEYPNPNACMSGAAVNILQYFNGSDITNIALTSTDAQSTGVIRDYSSFSKAGEDCSISRIYAGFNFRHSVDAGQQMGTQVGLYVQQHILVENKD
jgi:hypothetical protein